MSSTSATPTYFTNALGESRPILHYGHNPDVGCITLRCPFCDTGVRYRPDHPHHCDNPACEASEYATEATVYAQRAKHQARLEQEARRLQAHRLAMDRLAEDKAREAEFQAQYLQECRDRGACPLCSRKSGHRRVKYVVHRKPCPKGWTP